MSVQTNTPDTAILPPAQQQVCPLLAPLKSTFVLYGGTAITLYLRHRDSVDFDLFSHEPFQPESMIEEFPFLQGVQILQSQPNTLTVLLRPDPQATGTVKVSLFGDLDFGCLDTPHDTVDGVMRVASPKDLLAHKLKVLLQRVEPKDYHDIDALLNSGLDLAEGLAGAKLMFPEFAPQECAKALTYFKEKALRPLPADLKNRLVAQTARLGVLPGVSLYAATLSPPQQHQSR